MPKVTDWYLTNIINNDFVRDSFSESAIIASVRCLKRAKDQNLKIIHQLTFWTIFQKQEKFLRGQLRPCLDKFLSEFISEFRDSYSSYHFLIRFIENWIKALGPIWWTYLHPLTVPLETSLQSSDTFTDLILIGWLSSVLTWKIENKT